MGQVLKQEPTLRERLLSKFRKRKRYLKYLGTKGYELEQVRYERIVIEDRSCVRCGSRVKRQLDHIIPRALGGTHDRKNLQVLCKRCHKVKTKEDMKMIRKWRRVKAALYKEVYNGGGEGRKEVKGAGSSDTSDTETVQTCSSE
jgi:5-methylcytosine-specific restriction endonuclease McrA